MNFIFNYIRSYLNKYLPIILKNYINIIQVKIGYRNFIKNGFTDNRTYLAVIDSYCATNGKFIEKFANKIRHNPVESCYPIKGILGSNDKQYFQEVSNALNREGYFVFKTKLDIDSIKELLLFAKYTKSLYPPKYDNPTLFDESSLKAEIYRFSFQDLIRNPIIQNLIMDKSLIEVARNYLNAEPIFDFPAMWWSTTYLNEASSEAAQLYHFDFDRVKWLKLFIYLTDVGPDNGPHCYISGSHIPDAKPGNILKRGYVRVEDSELAGYYENDQFKTLYGEAGTIFAGDTKCWHKGTPLKQGVRLVLELQYTTSLFGINIPPVEISRKDNFIFSNFCSENAHYMRNIKIVE